MAMRGFRNFFRCWKPTTTAAARTLAVQYPGQRRFSGGPSLSMQLLGQRMSQLLTLAVGNTSVCSRRDMVMQGTWKASMMHAPAGGHRSGAWVVLACFVMLHSPFSVSLSLKIWLQGPSSVDMSWPVTVTFCHHFCAQWHITGKWMPGQIYLDSEMGMMSVSFMSVCFLIGFQLLHGSCAGFYPTELQSKDLNKNDDLVLFLDRAIQKHKIC